ncbi:thioredoxin-like protein [Sistotremastrum suecicum HHB10207 ss-3]|uniref:Thioredoxin-like protein n=1 Tax=Sistotremastrum suecicum HHB10207 ss-3 TaxID=1314776 RepID=A0A165Z616_9AGAM|nr:thioredoxin-like protein [Sistotremastrum suecicum HHB10207 ss-3]
MAVVQTQPNLPPSPISDDTSIGTKTPPALSSNATAAETPKGKEPRTISVVVVADMICPWCYIGLKEIEKAIQDLSVNLLPNTPPKFEIEYRPYPLNTQFGSDDIAVEKRAHYEKRFGADRQHDIEEMMKKRGREAGIEFKFGGMMRQTFRAHRLLWLSYRRGGQALQSALLHALYRAYFEEEKDIGDVSLLAFYADQVGLMKRQEAEKWLRSGEGEEEVRRLVAVAQRCGITGTPFTVVDGKWAISGGQESGVYYKIFERLAKGEMK